jgi:hypothetical protein
VGGPEDNTRQTENIPGIRMQLLRIFSGWNRHEPEIFFPDAGCSEKIPGPLTHVAPDFFGRILCGQKNFRIDRPGRKNAGPHP